MKKIRFVWILFSLVIFLTSLAAAPLAGAAMALVEVRNDADGGIMFVFRVEGQFPRSELKGYAQVQDGEGYPVYCAQVSETEVNCSTSRKTAGQNVSITFGGATFWTRVPDSRPLPSCQFEYNVYDWFYDVNTEQSIAWESVGTVCSDAPAQDGDIISSNLYNGVDFYDYEYFSTGVDNAYCTDWANAGPGYYYQDNYTCFN